MSEAANHETAGAAGAEGHGEEGFNFLKEVGKRFGEVLFGASAGGDPHHEPGGHPPEHANDNNHPTGDHATKEHADRGAGGEKHEDHGGDTTKHLDHPPTDAKAKDAKAHPEAVNDNHAAPAAHAAPKH